MFFKKNYMITTHCFSFGCSSLNASHVPNLTPCSNEDIRHSAPKDKRKYWIHWIIDGWPNAHILGPKDETNKNVCISIYIHISIPYKQCFIGRHFNLPWNDFFRVTFVADKDNNVQSLFRCFYVIITWNSTCLLWIGYVERSKKYVDEVAGDEIANYWIEYPRKNGINPIFIFAQFWAHLFHIFALKNLQLMILQK